MMLGLGKTEIRDKRMSGMVLKRLAFFSLVLLLEGGALAQGRGRNFDPQYYIGHQLAYAIVAACGAL